MRPFNPSKTNSKKDILIENNLLSWSVPDSDGLTITYFKENKTDLQSINATNDKVEDLEYLIEAAEIGHPVQIISH